MHMHFNTYFLQKYHLAQLIQNHSVPAAEGQRRWLKRKSSLPQKHADMLPWNTTPDVLHVDEHLDPKWAPSFPEVRHLLQTMIARVSWPKKRNRSFLQLFPLFKVHSDPCEWCSSGTVLLLTFNRRLLYLVVTLTAGDRCLWLNTSNRNLRCGYLSGGGNIWRMCFSDIYIPLEMRSVFCMTHIHVFHFCYF